MDSRLGHHIWVLLEITCGFEVGSNVNWFTHVWSKTEIGKHFL